MFSFQENLVLQDDFYDENKNDDTADDSNNQNSFNINWGFEKLKRREQMKMKDWKMRESEK
jgi:hypothetical protein